MLFFNIQQIEYEKSWNNRWGKQKHQGVMNSNDLLFKYESILYSKINRKDKSKLSENKKGSGFNFDGSKHLPMNFKMWIIWERKKKKERKKTWFSIFLNLTKLQALHYPGGAEGLFILDWHEDLLICMELVVYKIDNNLIVTYKRINK